MNESKDQTQKIAFPFLGRDHEGVQKILLAAPEHTEFDRLRCDLIALGSVVASQSANVRDSIVRLYEFMFSDLKDGLDYTYSFYFDDELVDLGGGLEPEHLRFRYWRNFGADDSAVLMSCNGVNVFKNAKNKWTMWERLLSEIETEKISPKLLVLGGDQYYQDSLESWMDQLTDSNFQTVREKFKAASLKNALSYFNHLSYRKIMARIPSVAMLDDHDITDGAGGRPEFVVDGKFTEQWTNFASVQRELFSLLQASRNPAPIFPKVDKSFSFVLDLGECAIVALDLRTEKQAHNKLVQEPDTQAAVFTAIQTLPHRKVLLLIPVVPLRNSKSVEQNVLGLASLATIIDKKVSRKSWYWSGLRKCMRLLAGLPDDVEDALSSSSNKDFFAALLKLMQQMSETGSKFTILSGDIHTGGSVEMRIKVGNSAEFAVPILVSSPIGYDTMNFIVEAFLREKKVLLFSHTGVSVRARNNAFTSNRNFMELIPDRLLSSPNEAAFIFEEGIEGSSAVVTSGWRADKSSERPAELTSIKSETKDREVTHEATL